MNKAYMLEVVYRVKAGKLQEFKEEVEDIKMAELSAKEPGNLMYEYRTSESNANELLLREMWINKNYQKAHRETTHFKELANLKNIYVEDTEIEEHEVYIPERLSGPVKGCVTVPGSKSMTNRALLLAALSKEKTHLSGVLFSDDSRHFLDSLRILGFEMKIDENNKTVDIQGCGGKIPNKSGTIDVGSAGTAARFLTAMLALSDGEYTINCSEQMMRRPMAELINILTEMGAKFVYLGEKGHLPVRVNGNRGNCRDISMDISKSTQFLSAMLMVAPVTKSGINILISSEKKDGAYIRITRNMLSEFGVNVEFDGEKYSVPGEQSLRIGEYYIEPDVSAACYFYGLAALTAGSITVKNVFKSSMQGDMKFLEVLCRMGCTVKETADGINVTGPASGTLKGIDIDMNDFSDQALTLAAIAPFASEPTVIRNIGHIRGQECDRMSAIVNELTKCGVKCVTKADDIYIYPGKTKDCLINTYDDHRVAMAFTLTGMMTEGVFIDNPMCCRKTFENYYEVIEQLIEQQRK